MSDRETVLVRLYLGSNTTEGWVTLEAEDGYFIGSCTEEVLKQVKEIEPDPVVPLLSHQVGEPVNVVLDLAARGYSAEDIVKLRREGLL